MFRIKFSLSDIFFRKNEEVAPLMLGSSFILSFEGPSISGATSSFFLKKNRIPPNRLSD